MSSAGGGIESLLRKSKGASTKMKRIFLKIDISFHDISYLTVSTKNHHPFTSAQDLNYGL